MIDSGIQGRVGTRGVFAAGAGGFAVLLVPSEGEARTAVRGMELNFRGDRRILKERTSLFRCSGSSRVRTGKPTPTSTLAGNPANGGRDEWAKAHFLLLQRRFGD
jgi:hypothetical protein